MMLAVRYCSASTRSPRLPAYLVAAGAVAVRAENKAGIYAGTSRSPATSTHSSAAFGNFGRIGASVAAEVGGGQTSRTSSCNAGAVAVRAEDK
eukprot:10567-Heterococcus_DN1.PRE.1